MPTLKDLTIGFSMHAHNFPLLNDKLPTTQYQLKRNRKLSSATKKKKAKRASSQENIGHPDSNENIDDEEYEKDWTNKVRLVDQKLVEDDMVIHEQNNEDDNMSQYIAQM